MKKYVLCLLILLSPFQIYSQENVANQGLSDLTNNFSITKGLTDSIMILGGAILAVGLIGVIYALANNKSHSKEAVISWFVGLFFYILLLSL